MYREEWAVVAYCLAKQIDHFFLSPGEIEKRDEQSMGRVRPFALQSLSTPAHRRVLAIPPVDLALSGVTY